MKLVYDIASLPKGLDVANLTKIFEQHHAIFWDSKNGGIKPKLYSDKDENQELSIVDLQGTEMDIEFWSQKFKDDEFWDKELHKCQQSPIYYFQNYVTPKYPARHEDITAYIKEIGLSELMGKDSDEAKKLWEEQKDKVKVAGASITIEFLKERKGVIDILKAAHYDKVLAQEAKYKDVVDIFDDKGQPTENKRRQSLLTGKIKQFPIPAKYGHYRTKKNGWDTGMLFATPYDVLLDILETVMPEPIIKKSKLKAV